MSFASGSAWVVYCFIIEFTSVVHTEYGLYFDRQDNRSSRLHTVGPFFADGGRLDIFHQ